VDSLQVHAPATVRLGTPETVAATVKQGARTVQVRHPMNVVWEGSPGLHVGPRSGIRPCHVAHLDPTTSMLTAIRPGQVKISATVNGITSSADVRLDLREAA